MRIVMMAGCGSDNSKRKVKFLNSGTSAVVALTIAGQDLVPDAKTSLSAGDTTDAIELSEGEQSLYFRRSGDTDPTETTFKVVSCDSDQTVKIEAQSGDGACGD